MGELHPQCGWQLVDTAIEYSHPEVQNKKKTNKTSVMEHSRPARQTPKNIDLVFKLAEKKQSRHVQSMRDLKPNRSSGFIVPQAGVYETIENVSYSIENVSKAAETINFHVPIATDAFVDVCDEATKAAMNFNRVLPKFEETFEKISSEFSQTNNDVRKFLEGLKSSASNLTSNTLDYAKFASVITGLGISFYGFMIEDSNYIAAGVMLCVVTGALSIMDPLVTYIRKLFDVKAQMNIESIRDFSVLVVTTISGLLCVESKGNWVTTIATRLEKMDRMNSSLEKALLAIIRVVEWVCDFIAQVTCGTSFSILRSIDPIVKKYSEEIEAIRTDRKSVV